MSKKRMRLSFLLISIYSTVAIYHNNFDRWALTYQERISIIIHEIGHTLNLADNDLTNVNTVMLQGKIQTIGPQQYDKEDIIFKWGE